MQDLYKKYHDCLNSLDNKEDSTTESDANFLKTVVDADNYLTSVLSKKLPKEDTEVCENDLVSAILRNPYGVHDISSLTEDELLHIVRKVPRFICNIDNPSEELQLEVISYNSSLVDHIKEPTEKVMKLVVSSDPNLIRCIYNPTEEVMLIAVEKSPSSIVFIKNPTEKVAIITMLNNPSLYEYCNISTPVVDKFKEACKNIVKANKELDLLRRANMLLIR